MIYTEGEIAQRIHEGGTRVKDMVVLRLNEFSPKQLVDVLRVVLKDREVYVEAYQIDSTGKISLCDRGFVMVTNVSEHLHAIGLVELTYIDSRDQTERISFLNAPDVGLVLFAQPKSQVIDSAIIDTRLGLPLPPEEGLDVRYYCYKIANPFGVPSSPNAASYIQ